MNILLLYSGGIDSTVLLYDLIAQRHEVTCITYSYGQRHGQEIHSARNICSDLGVNWTRFDLPRIDGSALTGQGDIPDGHYQSPSMAATVVPNRNMIMLARAAVIALEWDCTAVAVGCHNGDRAVYPDCRSEFFEAMQTALAISCGVELMAPYTELNKKEIVSKGRVLGVPFDATWTCYKGHHAPCGMCGACVERIEALDGA